MQIQALKSKKKKWKNINVLINLGPFSHKKELLSTTLNITILLYILVECEPLVGKNEHKEIIINNMGVTTNSKLT